MSSRRISQSFTAGDSFMFGKTKRLNDSLPLINRTLIEEQPLPAKPPKMTGDLFSFENVRTVIKYVS